MSIFYALISKNYNMVLSEYTEHTGNFQQITRILLYKLKNKYNKIGIIRYSKYIYSYITEENLTYLCISDEQDDNIQINNNIYLQIKQKEINIIFSFLIDIKKHFLSRYDKTRIESMKSYEIGEFERTICLLMNYYNNNPILNKSGIPIDKIYNIYDDIRIDYINDYLETYEIIKIIIIKNEFINNIALTNKNPLLSSYNMKEKLKSNFKICLKIIGCIFLFFFLIFLLVYNFGKKEDFEF